MRRTIVSLLRYSAKCTQQPRLNHADIKDRPISEGPSNLSAIFKSVKVMKVRGRLNQLGN